METLSLKTTDGLTRLTLSRRDRPVNVLDEICLKELEEQLSGLEQQPPQLLVIESGIPGCFIAGADVDVIAAVSDEQEAVRLAERGQSLMRRIEDLSCPSVAVVAGSCMGGGLELALACDYLLVVHHAKTRLALPEIKIGIHPGFGGCVRLPRKIGWLKATDMILTGRSVDAKAARRMHLADLACHSEQLEEAVRNLGARGKRRYGAMQPWWMRLWPARALFFAQVDKKALARFRHLDVEAAYPAVPAAIRVLREVAALPEGQAYALEAASLGRLAVTPTCANLIRVFHLGQGLQKQDAVKKGRDRASGMKQTAVFGAGVMGSGIGWVASKTGRVDLHDVSDKAMSRGLKSIASLARRDTNRMNRIRPVLDKSGLEHADLVIEAVLEEMEVKNNLWREVAERSPRSTLLLSNTSSLSISRMQESVKYPGRMAGMHFFNPAPKMPLVEVIAGVKTTQKTLQSVAALASSWGKYPVIVADRPGFLVNRCLMPFMGAAFGLLAAKGGAQSVQHIDGALKHFGMPMGAFELADRVGLDICRHVGEHLSEALGVRQALPEWFAAMVADGLLGEKSGSGFFVWKGGKQGELNSMLARYAPASIKPEKESNAQLNDAPAPMPNADVIDACLLPMLVEALSCLQEGVVKSAEHLDAAMVFGIGFPPFRGGLLHYYAGMGEAQLSARLLSFDLDVPKNLAELWEGGGNVKENQGVAS
ncbi:MAG: 3-hydroxyacyl-CoA dehydrogenase NAD-binding domain-containing protein [Mariprofundaceae bacterium]|nr:3-hydroxyacyl-CoA dehydrogenase NAD-binding domain-containing protein [Mariprofundaceae bacterium]